MKTCKLDSCSSIVFAKAFCQKHYDRFRKYGDPTFTKTSNREMPLLERLMRRTERSGDCINWLGSFRGGYGLIRYKGEPLAVHRLSWTLHNGEIPKQKNGATFHVLHKCDNQSCINPDHLFLGTHKENMEDMVKKGRSVKGSDHYRSKFSDDKVVEIKNMLRDGKTQASIARMFKVTSGCICMIANGTRRH